jgi:hypothetical protein
MLPSTDVELSIKRTLASVGIKLPSVEFSWRLWANLSGGDISKSSLQADVNSCEFTRHQSESTIQGAANLRAPSRSEILVDSRIDATLVILEALLIPQNKPVHKLAI